MGLAYRRQRLHPVPRGVRAGSECRACRQQRLHPVPREVRAGSECRVCWQQRLHLEPEEAARGSECRVCRRQRLHPVPRGAVGGSECRACCQQGLHPVPRGVRSGPECRVCCQHRLHSSPCGRAKSSRTRGVPPMTLPQKAQAHNPRFPGAAGFPGDSAHHPRFSLGKAQCHKTRSEGSARAHFGRRAKRFLPKSRAADRAPGNPSAPAGRPAQTAGYVSRTQSPVFPPSFRSR